MPLADQVGNGMAVSTHRGEDAFKPSVCDKTSLKPLELKDVSPSQEQDPNFSYEKDKSAVELTSVVEKFLKPNENIVAPTKERSSQDVKPLFSSIFADDPIRKRKNIIKDDIEQMGDFVKKEAKIIEKTDRSAILDTIDFNTALPDTNGQKFIVHADINSQRAITPDLDERKPSIAEANGEAGSAVHSPEVSETGSDCLSAGDAIKSDKEQDNPTSDDKKCYKKEKHKLLLFEDMPRHLQFNPYVKTGYRPLQNVWGCVHSLFYIHNETVNILTHGLPIFYIIYVVPKLLPWEAAGFPFLAWCHLAGALAPWCGSFVYHLFMNTSRGAQAYYRLLQLDMLGIWVTQSFGALPMLTATTFCMPWLIRWTLLIAYCLMSIWGLYKAMTAWSAWDRRLCFLLPFTMRAVLAWFRAGGWAGGSPEAISHIILQDAISAIGGVIGAIHIPERWFPGAMDIYLNSHNIMHIIVVIAVYFMHKATVLDIRWMSEVQCHGDETSAGLAEDMIPSIFYQL